MTATLLAECTVPEKLLLAAFQLEEAGHAPFTAEALIVAAWKKYPQTFGLKTFADQYPDSNKVLASIMGEKGLARRGWFAKMGQKLYTLTREGRQVVRRLLQTNDQPVAAEIKLTRDQERSLQHFFASSAFNKFHEGREPELNFADACRFWGITENLRGDLLDARLEQLEESLTELDRLLTTGHCTLNNGRSVSGEDIARLGDLHAFLEKRFSKHLHLLRSRVVRP